ncbi:MAG: molybdenum cofactor biosynthesis protein MoaE [Egibacteraceae bacterium]
MDARLHSRLTHEPLSLDAAWSFVAHPAAGGVVVFAGTVRDNAEGRAVSGLTYEAWQERAEAQLAALAHDVAARFGVRAVWLEHRTGALAIGESAVVVAVSAAHRDAAFGAARYGIDSLKAGVPTWKREHWSDGGVHWPGTD